MSLPLLLWRIRADVPEDEGPRVGGGMEEAPVELELVAMPVDEDEARFDERDEAPMLERVGLKVADL